MRWVSVLIMAASLYSCKPKPFTINYYPLKEFTLIDTCKAAVNYLTEKESSEYPIYYVGPVKDSISIGRRYFALWTPWKNKEHMVFSRKYNPENLDIRVITSLHTTVRQEYLLRDAEVLEDSTLNYHAFLITILNKSDSVLFMGRSFSLFMAWREAKDRRGNWIKIETPLHRQAICLSYQPEIFLNPKEIIVSKLPRYKGDFVTDFRLVFGYEKDVVYSNIFSDFIDEKILQHPVE